VTKKRRYTMNSTADSASVDEAGNDEIRIEFMRGEV
jgi:hypothetical protein